MKRILCTGIFLLFCLLSKSQIIINEVEANAGNNEGNGGEWIELKNIGSSAVDMSCWLMTNGGGLKLTFPQGLLVPAGNYVLIGDASKVMCATCDYKSLNSQFTLNTNGWGIGSGAYANTIFLNTDLTTNGGCGCNDGNGSLNNGTGLGDRIMISDGAGNDIDGLMYAGGNFYGTTALNVNFVGTSLCGVNSMILLDSADAIYNGRRICNDLNGCNSSYARLPDGNNGATVTWDQSGNLACTNCQLPCVSGAVNTASNDNPTPGLSNNTNTWTATLNGSPVTTPLTNLIVCGATPLTFQYQINNYTNAALTAVQSTGNLGSYTRTNTASPVNFTIANFNPSTGVTTLSSTVTPPNGLTDYEFVWGDANSNCAICPGATSTNVPNTIAAGGKECYVYHKVSVVRENALGGTPTVTCSLVGAITVNGAQGTNLQYTLQKQTTIGGPFTTIAGPQLGNTFSGIIDDDANTLLPNYQVSIASFNTVCTNPAPLIVAVPTSCMGNPVCPTYVTGGSGAATFTPASGASVCASSPVQFSVKINGVCTGGQVEMMYDYNPAFDPYTQGTSLGTVSTTVGATPPTTTATGQVFINEFMPGAPTSVACTAAGITPDGSSYNSGEWLELYNAGTAAVDMSGWAVSDGDWTSTIPAGTKISAGGYYLIGGGGTLCSSGQQPDLNVETCNCTSVRAGQDIMNLRNAGEQLALFDCSGNVLDYIGWGTGFFASGADSINATEGDTSLVSGCGNYIPQKMVGVGALTRPSAGTNTTGSSFSRTSTNTWLKVVAGTPKAANGTTFAGTGIPFGTQCPPPPVNATFTTYIPDTCSLTGATSLTLKAIYRPDPLSPCLKSDVTATANYTIPQCSELIVSGNGDYCAPSTAPIILTTATPFVGFYAITLTNGTNNSTLNAVTGAGPFTANVSNSGVWTVSSITAPSGVCAPKATGNATITISPVPNVTSVPTTASACYLYGFDLAGLQPAITTSPATSSFIWYDVPSGGSPISTYVNPSGTTTYYVSASSGNPANCEETTRTPVVLTINPLPLAPAISCTGTAVTFTPQGPDCTPTPCASGLEYSVDGINWGAGPSFSATDPGWAGFGSPTTSQVFIRNAASSSCYLNITYFGPCMFPLPTELFNFGGNLNATQTIDLRWQTAQEHNVAHFDIERSTDKLAFIKIGEVQAIGNTSVTSDYQFNDANPNNGSNYYRLKVVDQDLNYVYSNVILITTDAVNSNIAAMYPNPITNELNIDINAIKKEKTSLQVLDMLGHIVIDSPMILEKGVTSKKLNLQHLAQGQYMLRVALTNTTLLKKFVKE